MKRPQKRVLSDVRGVFLADDPGRDSIDDVAVALNQRLKCGQFTREGFVDQFCVGVCLQNGSAADAREAGLA